MKNPMVRKFAFHMILAGHRYSKAGQVSLADHKRNSHNLIDLFQCFLNLMLYITASLWGSNVGEEQSNPWIARKSSSQPLMWHVSSLSYIIQISLKY